jgi:hypothetical protein
MAVKGHPLAMNGPHVWAAKIRRHNISMIAGKYDRVALVLQGGVAHAAPSRMAGGLGDHARRDNPRFAS